MRHRKKDNNTRYQMREKLASIGDDYWIEDENGDKVFKVDGKAMRVRDTLKIEDRQGNVVCQVQERKLHIKDTMEIEDANGHNLATVEKSGHLSCSRPLFGQSLRRTGSGYQRQYPGSRIPYQRWSQRRRRSIQEVVSGARHLRRRGHARPERCAHPRHYRCAGHDDGFR